MAFPVQKRVDLSFLGAEWQGAELVFSGLTFKETRELAGQDFSVDENDPTSANKSMTFVVKFLTDHFLSGKGYNGEGLVPIKKEDLEDLPVEAINKSVELVTGQVDPKS